MSLTPPAEDNGPLRINEAARIADVSRGTIYNWIEDRKFKSWVVSRRGLERGIHYIDRKGFLEFVKSELERASV